MSFAFCLGRFMRNNVNRDLIGRMQAIEFMRTSSKVHTILIVDDTQMMRHTLKRILANQSYMIHEACNADEMFALLPNIEPDTILIDAMMPGISGFEACQICKAHDVWQHIPIIMVTSLCASEIVKQGLDAGADDFIRKPVNRLELRARVRSALRTKEQFDEMQQLLQMRDQMTSILVHDMRTPLSSIVLNVDIGSHFTDNPRVQKSLDVIKMQSEKLQSLVNDMLTAARLEDGQLMLNHEPIDLVQLVRSALQQHTDLAQKYQLTLAFESMLDSAEITADQRLIERVLDNLLSNALKFSPASSNVIVNLYQCSQDAQPYFCIDVSDEGAGVLPAERDLIFERFGIGSAQAQHGDRFGLGLPFCRLVIEAHGGTLTVVDNQPQGAIFRSMLPLSS